MTWLRLKALLSATTKNLLQMLRKILEGIVFQFSTAIYALSKAVLKM